MKAHQMYPQLTVRFYGEARDVCLHAWLLIRKNEFNESNQSLNPQACRYFWMIWNCMRLRITAKAIWTRWCASIKSNLVPVYVCVCFFGVWLCGCMDAWVEAACWCGSQFLRREHSGYPTPWRGGGVCGTGAGRVPGSRGLLHRRCVCVYLAFPMLWGPNVPTRIVMPVHFDLMGTVFGPHKENSLYIILYI